MWIWCIILYCGLSICIQQICNHNLSVQFVLGIIKSLLTNMLATTSNWSDSQNMCCQWLLQKGYVSSVLSLEKSWHEELVCGTHIVNCQNWTGLQCAMFIWGHWYFRFFVWSQLINSCTTSVIVRGYSGSACIGIQLKMSDCNS